VCGAVYLSYEFFGIEKLIPVVIPPEMKNGACGMGRFPI
jgi:hypothetical protein